MAKLQEIKEALRERKHVPIPEVGKWLAQVVAGYFAYHAVPTNSPALSAFRYHVVVLWHPPSNTRGRSRVRESRSLGSVRGAVSNDRPLYVAACSAADNISLKQQGKR